MIHGWFLIIVINSLDTDQAQRNVQLDLDRNCLKLGEPCIYHYRRVAEIQIFEKTYLIVIKDETGLKLKVNDSTFFSDWVVHSKIGSIILKNREITQCLQKRKREVRFLN